MVLGMCLSPFELRQQDATDWVAYKPKKFISQCWRLRVQDQGASVIG